MKEIVCQADCRRMSPSSRQLKGGDLLFLALFLHTEGNHQAQLFEEERGEISLVPRNACPLKAQKLCSQSWAPTLLPSRLELAKALYSTTPSECYGSLV